MQDLQVCRICLNIGVGVQMYDLYKYPYEYYFVMNPEASYLNDIKLPKYACYQCAALIKKCYFFKEKCTKGQSVLCTILDTVGEISIQNIEQLDRESVKLAPNYVVCNNVNETHWFTFHEKDDSEEECKKKESNIVELSLCDEKKFNDELIVDELPSLNEKILNDRFDLKTEIIKQEIFEDLSSPGYFSSDNDDEPLSVHKSMKETKERKIKKKGSKTKKENVNDTFKGFIENLGNVEASEDISDLPPMLRVTSQKKKRGRPPKSLREAVEVGESSSRARPRRTRNTGGVPDSRDDGNLEDYVTIIKLTLREQIEEVMQRQNSSNYKNAPFQCDQCYRGFLDTSTWRHHVRKHDPVSGEAVCEVCKLRFKTRRTLQKHVTIHEKKFACKSCSYVSKTTTQAKQHQRWHKGVTYKCQYCEEILTKWTSYLSHVRIKHPSEFICDVCGYSFVSKLGLTMHRTMMHKDVVEKESEGTVKGEGPYCAACDVQFLSEEGYKRHMVTSAKHMENNDLNSKRQGCRECGAVFSSLEDLRLHHRAEHAKKRPKNYGKKPSTASYPTRCEHCSEEILNAREHWAHFRRAHPDKNYPIRKDYICDICGKSFRGNAFLIYHKRTHQEERTYKCSECPKAFYNRTNLLMHARTHSDHRPHPCALCNKAFKNKGALNRHFRCHTGEKPYECEICGKAFGQSNSCKLHVRTVHLKQPAPYVSRARLQRKLKHRDAPLAVPGYIIN